MNKPREINRQGTVFWIVLSILLILRIVLASWTTYLFPATSVWIEPLYEIGTYLLITFLIWWERARLPLHHLDLLKEYWIVLIQSVLFTIAHIHLLDTPQPLLSFGILFMGGIIFGLFVWRSRSLSSSMAAHSFANGSISVQYWVYSHLFR